MALPSCVKSSSAGTLPQLTAIIVPTRSGHGAITAGVSPVLSFLPRNGYRGPVCPAPLVISGPLTRHPVPSRAALSHLYRIC